MVGTDNSMTGTNCQIFPIKRVLYGEVDKVENLLVKFDSYLSSGVLLTVHHTSWNNHTCLIFLIKIILDVRGNDLQKAGKNLQFCVN
jgi:hypothetical protein